MNDSDSERQIEMFPSTSTNTVPLAAAARQTAEDIPFPDASPARLPARLPVRCLRVWPGNPRKAIDPAALDELTASVRSLRGVKTPLLVRPLPTPEGEVTHEVLAGQRRLLAARAAELAEVPVSVEDLDDASALELALSENGSRRDASPLEDAEAVERLITEHGRSVDRAARVIGRSVRWVERRRSLLRLVPDARAWLRGGELPVGHAEALAALDQASQEDVLQRFRLGGAEGYRDPGSARAWARELSYAIRALVHAPWELGDKSYPGGACTGCPRRSDAQQDLFGVAIESAHCLDRACWDGKVAAHWEHAKKAAKRRKLTVVQEPCVHGYSKSCGYDSEYATLAQVPEHVEVPVVALGRDERGAVYDLVRRADLVAAVAKARDAAVAAGDEGDEGEGEARSAPPSPLQRARDEARELRRARERQWGERLLAMATEGTRLRDLVDVALGQVLREFDCSPVLRAEGAEAPAFPSHGEIPALVESILYPRRLAVLVASLVQASLDPDVAPEELTITERELVALLDAPEAAPASSGALADASPAPGPDASQGPAQPPPLPAVRVWVSEGEWDGLDPAEREDLSEPIGGAPVAWEGREGYVTALVDSHAVLVCLRGAAGELGIVLHEGEAPPAPPLVELRVSRSEWQRNRSELQDSSTGLLHKEWLPANEHRVAYLPPGHAAVAKVIDRAKALGLALTVNGKPIAEPVAAAKAAKAAKTKKGGAA